MTEGFILNHKSPRFDINGKPCRPFTVKFSPEYPTPSHWTSIPQTQTRTELLKKRRQEFIPDITYDIDGDGFVDQKDMAIAKIFDKNNDGILDTQEREEVRKAISQGLMDKYLGLGQSHDRTQNKLPMRQDTLNRTQNNSASFPSKTIANIKEQQRTIDKAKAEGLISQWIEKHPSKIEYVPYRVYSDPEFKTLTEKKKFLRQTARAKIGLNDPDDIKDFSKDPKYKYVENPPVSGFQEFKANRKQQMVTII